MGRETELALTFCQALPLWCDHFGSLHPRGSYLRCWRKQVKQNALFQPWDAGLALYVQLLTTCRSCCLWESQVPEKSSHGVGLVWTRHQLFPLHEAVQQRMSWSCPSSKFPPLEYGPAPSEVQRPSEKTGSLNQQNRLLRQSCEEFDLAQKLLRGRSAG